MAEQVAHPETAMPSDQLGRRPGRLALAFYAFCRVIAMALSRSLFPGRPVGAERLPRYGAYILAPVHRSNLDWLIVARLTRRRLRYLVKAEVWKVPGLGPFIELLGAFPVHRDAADRESLQRCLAVLEGGEPLVLFPEGTRRSGPVVDELREGAAYLALRAGVPIYPVGLAGTERAMPRGARLFHPTRVTLVVGEAVTPAAREISDGGRATRVTRSANRALTEELRLALERALADALALEQLRRGTAVGSAAELGGASAAPSAEQDHQANS